MNYSGLNAKVKAMQGRLLRAKHYEALCDAGTVAAFGTNLENSPAYRAVFKDDAGQAYPRGQIEPRLRRSLYQDFARLIKFVTDVRLRQFLKCYFLKHEVHILKARLAHIETAADFMAGFSDTDFYPVLSPIYNEKTTLFQLETQLDLHYYAQLHKSKNRLLNQTNRAVINRLIGTEIDLQNILRIYRLKTFYDLPQSQIYSSLLPYPHRLSVTQTHRLIQARDTAALDAEISKTAYGRVFARWPNPEEATTWAMSGLYRAAFAGCFRSLAATLGYLFYKEREIKNLVSILEGIRYGLAPHEIMGYVHCLMKGDGTT